MANYPGVSISVIRRLPRYYRFLEELDKNGVERISSKEFAQLIGVTASQIRQDLNCFGGFGQQGYGYNVRNLYEKIGSILALEKKRPTILIGAGNLGLALATHMRFEDRGFRLLGVFDDSPAKIGMPVAGGQVLDAAGLEAFCAEHKPEIAILSIPKQAAVELAPKLVEWGVRGFWNFSHYDLSIHVSEGVVVENVHLGDSLMTLSYRVNEAEAGGEE